jgi:hypothetical protein
LLVLEVRVVERGVIKVIKQVALELLGRVLLVEILLFLITMAVEAVALVKPVGTQPLVALEMVETVSPRQLQALA